MKVAIWIGFGVLSLLWTGAAAVLASLAGWAGQVMASGDVADWVRMASQWPVPAWVAIWIDPQMVKGLQEAMAWSLQALGGALPFAGQLVGWLVPIAWAGWGFGMLGLLALAAAGHWWVGRSGTRRPPLASA